MKQKLEKRGNQLFVMTVRMVFFHKDIIFPNGDKEKKAIAITNLETALSYAEQDIKDRWEFYKEKYLKLIKK